MNRGKPGPPLPLWPTAEPQIRLNLGELGETGTLAPPGRQGSLKTDQTRGTGRNRGGTGTLAPW